MSKSVLVLGASGFIGRQIAESLARTGTPVIAATRSPASFDAQGISSRVSPFDDPSHFAELLPGCSAVVHAASISTPGSSAAKPQLDGNLRTTLSLIEALQGSPSHRLVYLSSGGTLYGNRQDPAKEEDPLRPRSYHGAGKIAAEFFIRAWSEQYGGTAVILRPSNIYGPGQLSKHDFGIVPTAFERIVRDASLPILGDGSSVRDYLFIDDFIRLCSEALFHDFSPGTHVFNAASGEGVRLDELLDAIDGITNRPLIRKYQPARSVDVHRILLDIARTQTQLGWRPEVALEEGLRRTWQWFNNTR